MATVVIMPRNGQSVESCVITAWNKKGAATNLNRISTATIEALQILIYRTAADP